MKTGYCIAAIAYDKNGVVLDNEYDFSGVIYDKDNAIRAYENILYVCRADVGGLFDLLKSHYDDHVVVQLEEVECDEKGVNCTDVLMEELF